MTIQARLRATVKRLPHWLQRLLARVRASVFDVYAVKSYSQEGEDLLLRRIFGDKECGFYVDVGAHHPNRFSNTHGFYQRGWHGINVEPNPDAMGEFRVQRSRDVNLQCGVGAEPGRITYYLFDEPALNTFDRSVVDSRVAATRYKLKGTIEVAIERLDHILEKYLPPNQSIDFFSIDTEGFDLQVLQSNDWRRYRPRCILVESLGSSLEDVMGGDIFRLLRSHGYELFAKTFNTLIFRERAHEPNHAS